MKSYEFNITVVGSGKDADEAFSDALSKLAQDAGSAIKGEVIYVNLSESEDNSNDKELEN
jgi:hypothetical protein|tara:strand:- start:5264 stop:5443 length:180 start_codon:yes stop_codon:yes gene_type:complete